ncbi:MAG: bifunctional phosphopantothenoylcysteine decarboxylase/phosphopantothenate--cysteine ligase CoaBC [Bacteroidota bacterium]
MISGKKILLGVTGSIAAYKSAMLVRLLVKNGCEVKVVMTDAAIDFVAPLTFSVLSKNPVASTFSNKETGEWNNHVEMGLWADAMIIAPATANTMAEMAGGICNNLLLAVYLSARCPVFIAPAMDLDMWKHPATVSNIEKLKMFGNKIIIPGYGELASGLTGEGRMEEPENILEYLRNFFSKNLPLRDKKILVTAGPTYEKIDPVRFIGNRSSGKMGYAIADELAQQGAVVTLVSGPSAQTLKDNTVNKIDVESAKDMYEACMKVADGMDVIIMAAAVADYRPQSASTEKIKKQNNPLAISLTATDDILLELGKRKKNGQLIVGFALETENELVNAKEKIRNKNLDFIVLNSLKDKGAGFNYDTNRIKIIDRNTGLREFELKSKSDVAKDIVNVIVEHLKK